MRFGATLMCGTISVHVTLVVLFVFTYVNVHRCQEDDGRVQVLMVERPSSLKLRNKQRIHRNGSDQYIKNYYKMCHVMMEYLFIGKRKCILLILVDVVGVTTYLNYANYTHVLWNQGM